MPSSPVFQVFHISDLHLTASDESFKKRLQYLKTIPKSFLLKRHILEREDPYITSQLYNSLMRWSVDGIPGVIALTGDIGTWPGDSPQLIDQYHYSLVSVLPFPVIPILGNHDWGPLSHRTAFQSYRFDSHYQITTPRFRGWKGNPLGVVFFTLDSNIRMFPPFGRITDNTVDWLKDRFYEGHVGQLGTFSPPEYQNAIKVILLHHSPLERSAYQRRLSRKDYFLLHLAHRKTLVAACSDNIDFFLFGHTHLIYCDAIDGFVFVNCGTTSAQQPDPTPGGAASYGNTFIRVVVYSDYLTEMTTFLWDGTGFIPFRTVRFRPNAYSAAKPGGYRRWGRVP